MQVLSSSSLSTVPSIRHGFFHPGDCARVEDNLSFKNGTEVQVQQARRNACALLGIQSEFLACLFQEHGTVIWRAERTSRGCGALTGEGQIGNGDGLITCERHVPLTILIADCLPVFFASRDGVAIGLAHAGWRGTHGNISGKMVRRFETEFAVPPSELLVWIGPGISRCCFQVKDDVWGPFQQDWGHLPSAFDVSHQKIDLKAINQYQLQDAGVPEAQIDVSSACTCCNPIFFSYRRDGDGIGHNMAVIQIDGEL
ncbi:MAG: peptidoglycan editing factor PgeF [bacterium]|jgi:YfiH family protein|nr:peptidoglycan editing factor PgeF [bacterium]